MVYFLPSNTPGKGEQWIPNPLSGMEVPDEKRLGKSNDEINEDRTRKESEKNFASQ